MKKTLGIILVFLIIAVAGTAIGWYALRSRTARTHSERGSINAVSTDQISNAQSAWQKAVGAASGSDSDLDGVTNVDETKYKTNPNSTDTDGDGLSDKTEITVTKTDPTKADTDGDGVNDGMEVRKSTKPLDPKSF